MTSELVKNAKSFQNLGPRGNGDKSFNKTFALKQKAEPGGILLSEIKEGFLEMQ